MIGKVKDVLRQQEEEKAKQAIQTARNETNDLYNQGLSRGQQLYQQMMGQDSFQGMWDQRSEAQKEIADRRRDLSRGLSAQENAAARGMFESAVRRSGATQRSSLAANLAGRGMGSGGFANSQRAALEANLGDQLVNAERQLLLDNVNARNQGLTNYENTINQQEGGVWDQLLNQYNASLAGGQQAVELDAAERNRRLEQQKIRAQRRRFLGIF